MIRKFAHCFNIPGTLVADINIRFRAPSNCTLQHVSVVGSNDNDAEVKIGTSADDDGFLELKDIGSENTPAIFTRADFDGDLITEPSKEPARIRAGDIVVVTIVYGDVKGTAAQNVTAVLTFAEG